VSAVQVTDAGFRVETNADTRFLARTIFIAGGVGSFQPRRIRLAGIEQFEGNNLFYSVRDPKRFADRNVIILGGGDSALDWTLALAPDAKSLTLVHRRDEYRAAPATVQQMQQLVSTGKVRALIGKVTDYRSDNTNITGISVENDEGVHELDCDDLLVFYGLAPKLGPIAEWGLDINRKTINVDTEKFETSEPGIYAIGDINHYPGKKKLILSGFHEAALAAFAAKERLEPGKKARLQYTTTSPLMHERLGVKD
jgi:thioredoxin reductase (NADPH)